MCRIGWFPIVCGPACYSCDGKRTKARQGLQGLLDHVISKRAAQWELSAVKDDDTIPDLGPLDCEMAHAAIHGRIVLAAGSRRSSACTTVVMARACRSAGLDRMSSTCRSPVASSGGALNPGSDSELACHVADSMTASLHASLRADRRAVTGSITWSLRDVPRRGFASAHVNASNVQESWLRVSVLRSLWRRRMTRKTGFSTSPAQTLFEAIMRHRPADVGATGASLGYACRSG